MSGNPTQIDYFEVAKPSSLSAAAGKVAPAPFATGVPLVHNGVDQRALADCLAADASRCLQTVPGLAACVRVHSTCNVTAAETASRATGVKATVESVRASAARALGLRVGASTHVEVSTVDSYAAAGVAKGDRVLVVTGKETVTRLQDRPLKAHHGYRLVYHETSGVLLDACLGSACLSGTG